MEEKCRLCGWNSGPLSIRKWHSEGGCQERYSDSRKGLPIFISHTYRVCHSSVRQSGLRLSLKTDEEHGEEALLVIELHSTHSQTQSAGFPFEIAESLGGF